MIRMSCDAFDPVAARVRSTAAGTTDSTAKRGWMSPKEENMDLRKETTAEAVRNIPRIGRKVRYKGGDNETGAFCTPDMESTDPGMTPSSLNATAGWTPDGVAGSIPCASV